MCHTYDHGCAPGLVLERTTGVGGLGVVLGLAGPAVATSAIKTLLIGVEHTDPVSIFSDVALLIVVSAAAYMSNRRAKTIDPAALLRS